MIRKMKKSVSFLLTVLLTFTLFIAVPPVAVHAAVDDEFTDSGSGLKFKVLTEDSTAKTGTVMVEQGGYTETSYTIPTTVTTNGGITYTVTTIANFAFQNCSTLSAISIPDSVTTIDLYAFSGTSISAVTIPAGVSKILDSAFSECSKLTAVTFKGVTPPEIANSVFFNNTATTITIPAGTVDYYAVALTGKLPAKSHIVSAAATISGVTVSSPDDEVERGRTMTFSATVSGTGSFGQAVEWSVTSSYGSSIGQTNGILSIVGAERANELTVKAVSKADLTVSGTAIVKVKPSAPLEKFSLAVGSTCYFDLSSITTNSTTAAVNTALPDTDRKWVPFTYVGTVNAYSLADSANGVTSASETAAANLSSRSLFLADYNIYQNISWENLNEKNLIYGKDNYSANGVSYLLRSLSAGSSNLAPLGNEWDQILAKDDLIHNYDKYSWGQDTAGFDATRRVLRGNSSASFWNTTFSTYSHNTAGTLFYGYRPALEVLNASSLSSNALKTVIYDMGSNGTLGTGTLTTAAVVYTGELTLPEIAEGNGFKYTGAAQSGKVLGWYDGSVFYAAGTKLSSLAGGTVLTAGYGTPVNTNTGSDGGHSGGGGTSTGTSEVEKSGDSVTAVTEAPAVMDTSGKATASVTKDQVSAAVNSAVAEAKKQGEGTSAVVEIKVGAPANANSVETGIPKEAVGLVASGGTDALKVSTPVASIFFDTDALAGINKEATGDVKITTAKVDTSTLTDDTKELIGDRPVFNFSITSGNSTISEFGGNVTVAVPYTPKDGEDTDAIVIYYINSEGKPEAVANCKYDPVTKTVSFTTNHFSKYAVGYNKVNFSDVKAGAWYENAVDFAAARGIVTGTGNGNYSPDGKLTRGQLLVMLMRAYGIEPDTNLSGNFTDAGNTYYTGYLAAAKRLGITDGLGNNLYAPDKQITRQEMFTLLYNTLKVIGQLPEGTGKTSEALAGYSDAGSVASWAKDASGALADAGVVSGSNGKLSPKNTTTRAEMAQVLYNLLSK
jgi:hypothetical protein